MALLQLLKKALLLLNVGLMLLLNMTGKGIAAATKKGIISAKDGAVTVLNYIHTRSLQPSALPCQNSVFTSLTGNARVCLNFYLDFNLFEFDFFF
jgi:hypothetical protein